MNEKIKSTNLESKSQTKFHDIVEFPNLLPLMFQEYRTSALNKLKNWFLDSLLECIKAEREYCTKHKLEPAMTQDKIDKIQSILDKCKNVYEIQALADYLFLDNYVPDTYEQVEKRGFGLKLRYPLLEGNKRRR